MFCQVVLKDGGADADAEEPTRKGDISQRPGSQDPDESAERREEERVSLRRRDQQPSLSHRLLSPHWSSLSVCLALHSCVLLLSQKLSLLELRHTVQSLRSSEASLLSQKALLDAKMAAAVASPPPPALPALQYEDDTRSVSSTVNEAVSEAAFPQQVFSNQNVLYFRTR